MHPPTVNVIKSKENIVASSNGATDGDTTKRTNNYILDTNRAVEHLDFLSGSPIVH